MTTSNAFRLLLWAVGKNQNYANEASKIKKLNFGNGNQLSYSNINTENENLCNHPHVQCLNH